MDILSFSPVSAPDVQVEMYLSGLKSLPQLSSLMNFRSLSSLCPICLLPCHFFYVFINVSFELSSHFLLSFYPLNISPFLKFFLTAVHIVTFFSGCPYTSAKTNIWPKRNKNALSYLSDAPVCGPINHRASFCCCFLAEIGPVTITTDPKKFQYELRELYVQVSSDGEITFINPRNQQQ